MTNPIIPEAEVNAVKKVIEAVEELKELNKGIKPIFNGSEDDLDKIHILAYLHFMKDLFENIVVIKELLEMTREDFHKYVTDNGEMEIFEVLKCVMASELLVKLK